MAQKNTLISQMVDSDKSVQDEVARLIRKHGKLSPIAEKLNVSNSTISYHLKAGGFTKGWYRVPDDDIVAKYAELLDENAVALHFNIAAGYVHDALLRKLNNQLTGESDG